MILADGGFRYEALEGWAKIPSEVDVGDIAAVAVSRRDHVYLFTRGEHPIIVLDSEGEVLHTWGHGHFTRPHGLHIGDDEAIYCTDDGAHCVLKFSLDGKLLARIGVPGSPSPFMSGLPFHRCTHTALSPRGDLYVSDGYGNACVHKFDPNGRHLLSWGQSGRLPGEFYIPHNIVCDEDGWVYVADRENHRIQVFDNGGRFEAQWSGLHRPCALCRGARGEGLFYVGEVGPAMAPTLGFPNLGPRISIVDQQGAVCARLSAGPAGLAPGCFVAPHGIAVNARGDIYVSEVTRSAWPQVFPGTVMPANPRVLTKLRRLDAEIF
jgi:streptogramin lyase